MDYDALCIFFDRCSLPDPFIWHKTYVYLISVYYKFDDVVRASVQTMVLARSSLLVLLPLLLGAGQGQEGCRQCVTVLPLDGLESDPSLVGEYRLSQHSGCPTGCSYTKVFTLLNHTIHNTKSYENRSSNII